MKRNCRPLPLSAVAGGSNGFSTDCASKEALSTRSLPIGSTLAFQKLLEPGGYARKTIQTLANTLRVFFRFAEARGWCRRGLASSIQSPRVFSQTSLPLGPSWDDVRRLLAMTEGDRRSNIRARPILMLLAIYGLRRGEVSRLRLEDFDWEHEVFRVESSKTRRVRTYPLIPMTQAQLDLAVARAIGESLKAVRLFGFGIANPEAVSYDPEPARRPQPVRRFHRRAGGAQREGKFARRRRKAPLGQPISRPKSPTS